MYPNETLTNPFSPTSKITFLPHRDKELIQPIYVKPDPTGDELLDEMLDLQAYRAHQAAVREYDATLEANIRKLQNRFHYFPNKGTIDTEGCFLCPPKK